METCLTVDGLRKRYRGNWLGGTEAVQEVSFAIACGEAVGLLGPNGAGKTTTFKSIAGLVRPTRGRIEIMGLRPQLRSAREVLGYLPEEPRFHDFLTGEEVVTLAATLSGIRSAERTRRVAEVLDLVGLGEARARRVRTYSKGMKQRVGIAQAIVGRPRLVLLDEPMTGLDPIGRREVRDLIEGLPRQGAAVVFSTHVLQDVELACDRVIMMARGRVVRDGRLDELLAGVEAPVEVTVRGLRHDAAAELAARFPAARRGPDGRVTMRVANAREAEAVRAEAVARGGELVALVPSATLEDAFLRAVGAEGRAP